MVEFKDFSRLLSDFPVLFKADLISKDFSRKPSKFKYFSSLWEPWLSAFVAFSGHIHSAFLMIDGAQFIAQLCGNLAPKIKLP